MLLSPAQWNHTITGLSLSKPFEEIKLEQFLLAYKNSIFQDSNLYKQLW